VPSAGALSLLRLRGEQIHAAEAGSVRRWALRRRVHRAA
jgi:hypothetical protein